MNNMNKKNQKVEENINFTSQEMTNVIKSDKM